MILIAGALLGFISVAFGAFAEHGLREHVTSEHFRFLMTAIRYNQVHSVIICVLGLALINDDRLSNIRPLKWSAFLFIAGTILFSFSIYVSVAFEMPELVNVTPLGGITIMVAWLLLVLSGMLAVNQR